MQIMANLATGIWLMKAQEACYGVVSQKKHWLKDKEYLKQYHQKVYVGSAIKGREAKIAIGVWCAGCKMND